MERGKRQKSFYIYDEADMAHALIIEDDTKNMKILAQLLTLEGVTSTGVLDPNQLMDTLHSLDRLDVIFLDLELPHKNGFEIIEMLKQELDGSIPIVACTVHTSQMDTAQDMGFHSFIGKPLHPDRFPEQLRQILSGEPVWDMGSTTG
jgi:CheY-like chemotaxis protein